MIPLSACVHFATSLFGSKMAKLILWILIVSNCGLCVRASADALAVVGYLPDYRIDEVRPVERIPASVTMPGQPSLKRSRC